MRIDTHVHIVGRGEDIERVNDAVYFYPDDNQHWFTRLLYNLVEDDLKKLGGDTDDDGAVSTTEYFDLIYRLLKTSEEVDGVVLLALDAVFSPRDGRLDRRRTDLWVSNRFLHSKVDELNQRLDDDGLYPGKRFFLGASVSPNRDNWESELSYALQTAEAVLLKLIPSTQHVRMGSSQHDRFFSELAATRLPLLCHVGPEYAFPEGIRQRRLDSFRFLDRALDRGVTVIAAHCATPVFPFIDRDEVAEFRAFMRSANGDGTTRLWADTSGLSMATRIPLIPRVLDSFNPEELVHGSDFPIPMDAWTHLPLVTHDVSPEEYLAILRTKNPLDRDVRLKRAMGFADSILDHTEKVLRLPRA